MTTADLHAPAEYRRDFAGPVWFLRIVDWLDERGKWAWLAAMVAGFVLFWPIGLAILAYMIWSKRMFGPSPNALDRRRNGCASRRSRQEAWEMARTALRPSGNAAFDAYKAETLRRLEEVLAACGRALARGERIYWICPAIAAVESAAERAAATARFHELSARFGALVGLAHGRQPPAERNAVMADFAAGRIALLVATTVVEVGIDVPEASVIVIEGAERFGLSQLHQLRGRVISRSSAKYRWMPLASASSRVRLRTMSMSASTA